jgi:hypothetical protein
MRPPSLQIQAPPPGHLDIRRELLEFVPPGSWRWAPSTTTGDENQTIFRSFGVIFNRLRRPYNRRSMRGLSIQCMRL